jgi:phosphotransferase system enzyme I (PtsI)
MLNDPAFKKSIFELVNKGANAEFAVFKVSEEIVNSFETIEDNYFMERKFDIKEIEKKLLKILTDKSEIDFSNIDSNSIIVAHNLTSADTVSMRENSIKGFATDVGGKTSHTAIVAQGFGIPAVTGLKELSNMVKTGDDIIIDGDEGKIILNPTNETVEEYNGKCKVEDLEKEELVKIKNLFAQTSDGHKVLVCANIEYPDEVFKAVQNGADGIGLYRTEFMYMGNASMPDENKHFENYCEVIKEKGKEHSTVIRTIDLGGDKLAERKFVPETREENPFMGLRAIRLSLRCPGIFKEQLRGVLRTSAYGNIKLMYPMISGVEEIEEANKLLEEAKNDLKKLNVAFDENIQVGAMIEIPSAVIMIDAIAEKVDFVSIGTNDLIQYTIAVDRGNETVANLYDPLNPAVIRSIKKIIDEAHLAGIKVGMCGAMASDPRFSSVLLGLGLDEFSVAPSQISKIKKTIRNLNYSKACLVAEEMSKAKDKKTVYEILEKVDSSKNL